MVDLDRLTVSLTKNGYLKVAALLKLYNRWQVMDHLEGDHEGIDIKPSQIKNMLDQNTATGEVPQFWDDIRAHGDLAIDAFTCVAMLFSHGRMIRLFQAAGEGRDEFTGYFLRADLPREKEYTNIAFALACFGLCDYRRGANAIEFDLTPVIYHLRNCGELVRELLRSKLLRSGWVDPARNPLSTDQPFMVELRAQQFNRVLSMEWQRFADWIEGRLTMIRFTGRFGLNDVGLFRAPGAQAERRSAPA